MLAALSLGCATKLLWDGRPQKTDQQLLVVETSGQAERFEIVTDGFREYKVAFRLDKAVQRGRGEDWFPGVDEGLFTFQPWPEPGYRTDDAEVLGTILGGAIPLDIKVVKVRIARRRRDDRWWRRGAHHRLVLRAVAEEDVV